MQDTLQRAEKELLLPAGLSLSALQDAAGSVMSGLDWADIYVERRVQEGWHLEEGIVKSGSYSDDSGIGLRAVCGETTAYASSDILAPATLAYLKETARVAKTYGGAFKCSSIAAPACPPPRFGFAAPQAEDKEKIALLNRADALCRRHPQVENVMVSLAAGHTIVLIVRADGGLAADYRPMLRFNVQVTVCDSSGRRETGYAGGGGRGGYGQLSEQHLADFCTKAVEDAVAKLQAADAPAGKMPVVLGPGWAGILLHEAVGHGLEGDFNRKKLSAFSGRVGEKVAADGVTVIDAGNISGRRGSLTVDDEGTPTQETVLIENGV